MTRHASLLVVATLTLAACSSAGVTTTGPSGSSSGTSGSGGGGTGGHAPAGQPISAPAEQWTWVPFDDAFCGDGSTTGIGVNLTDKSSRVVVYFEGGGACWSDVTCYTLMTASYFTTGYGESDFMMEAGDATYLALPGGFFDRSAAANPLKDYSYVYVPYCTGDIHAGDNLTTYGTHTAHHVGFKNVAAYLTRLVATFPKAERVIVAGSSAGGFGAAYNWWQTQQAFGIPSANTATSEAAWNLAATLPPACSACKKGLDALFPFYAKSFPGQRGALLSYIQDAVLPTYFGISEMQFETGLSEVTSKDLDPTSSLKYFLVNASGHVLWFSPQLATNGVTVQQFVTQMVTDAKDWNSVHP